MRKLEITRKGRLILLISLIVISVPFWFPRSIVLDWLKVPAPASECPELAVVFGGGFLDDGSPGYSSRERLETFLDWWDEHNCDCRVLISEYAGGRDRLEHVLIQAGFPSNRFVRSGFPFSEQRSGTVQNAEEVVHVLAQDSSIQSIAVFTSPYHQYRVNMILRDRLSRQMDGSQIQVYFIQMPDNGEIMTCSRYRFLRLVGREFVGIVIQAIRLAG